MTDFNTELTREQNATAIVSQIKSTIKTVATNKGISVGSTDTPLSVLSKIDNGTIATPTEQLDITQNGVQDVTNYASVNVNVESGGELPSFMSAKNFTFDGNACTGYVGDNDLPEIIIPQSYSIAEDGSFIDGSDYQVTSVVGNEEETTSGFENYTGRIVLLDNITTIGPAAFAFCPNLQAVDVSRNITSIGDSSFSSCSSLTSITIPEGVTSIGEYVFIACQNLVSIVIPDSVVSIGFEAVYNCGKVTSITIGENAQNIDLNAFSFNSNLRCIIVNPNNNYYSNDEYGVLFNKDKTELIQYSTGSAYTSYQIPNSVTQIAENSFNNNANLTHVTMGNNITSIGYAAFIYCLNLTTITIEATTPPTIDWNTFDDTVQRYEVPAESVEAYKTATNWANYADKIFAIQTV